MNRSLLGQTLLNRYRVDSLIAAGGMGSVYRVWDAQRNTMLAMKVLHAELAEDPAFIRRFEREARTLQNLAHPNIVPFYGLYRSPDLTFLLERYIDGPSLNDVLRARGGAPLPLRDVLAYARAIFAALGYAHSKGIIHLDIKPANVLLDQSGSVFLTDFGIARYTESAGMTTAGGVGTPAYMAPEQIRAETLSPATDVYALGVLLFELLTGRRPFRGDEPLPPAAGPTLADKVRYAQQYMAPPDPRSINREIAPDLAAAILRAMNKDPRARFQSIDEFGATIFNAAGTPPQQVADRVDWVAETQARPVIPPAAAPRPAPPPATDGFGAGPHREKSGSVGVFGSEGSYAYPSPFPPPLRRRRPFLSTLLLLLLLAACVGGAWYAANAGLLASLQLPGLPTGPGSNPGPDPGSAPAGDLPDAGEITYVLRDNGQDRLYTFDLATRETSPIPAPEGAEWSWAPQWSPDGQRLAWFSEAGGRQRLYLWSPGEGQPREVEAALECDRIHSPAWLAPDRLGFYGVGDNQYWLGIADPESGALLDRQTLPYYRNLFSWNQSGGQAAFVEQTGELYDVAIAGSATDSATRLDTGGEEYAPSWSYNGDWLAFQGDAGRERGQNEIWLARPDGSEPQALTESDAGVWNRAPTWSGDGSWIAFVSNRAGSLGADFGELFIVEVASGTVHQLTETGGRVYDWRPAWRPE